MKGKKIKIFSLIVTGLIIVTTMYAKSYNTTSKIETSVANAGSVSTEAPFTQEQVLSAAVDVAMNGYKYGANNKVGFNSVYAGTYEYFDCSTFIGTVMEKLGCTLVAPNYYQGVYQFDPTPWYNKQFTYLGPDGNRYAPELVITADQTAENPGWFNAVSADGTVVSDVLQPGDIISSKSHMFMYVGKADSMEDMLIELKNYNNGNDIETLNSNTVNYAYSNSAELGKLSYEAANKNSSNYWLIEGNIGRNVAARGYGAAYEQRGIANTNRPYLTSFNWAGKVGAKGTPTIHVFRIAKVPEIKGEFTLNVVKRDSETNKGLSGAKFNVEVFDKETGEKLVDSQNVEVDENGKLTFEGLNIKKATYVIKITETEAPRGYNKVEGTIEFEVNAEEIDKGYKLVADGDITVQNAKSVNVAEKEVTVEVGNEQKRADLALTKEIVKVEREDSAERYRRADVPETGVLSKGQSTADYIMDKSLVDVKIGDTVTYSIKVYNEGNVTAFAKEITDYLPKGLEFKSSKVDDIDYKWDVKENEDGTTTISTKFFENQPIEKYNGDRLDFIEVKVQCKVGDFDYDTILTNVAEITKYGYYIGNDFIEANEIGVDRDSEERSLDLTPANIITEYENRIKDKRVKDINKKQTDVQDDDDFENIRVVVKKELDLALRKSITAVNGESVIDGYNLEENRLPSVTVETAQINLIGKKDENGSTVHNGAYFHDKKYVTVRKDDLVTYTIRVYNEGLDNDYCGFAREITDYLPDGLEFVEVADNSTDEWYSSSAEGDTVVKLLYHGNKTLYNNSLLKIYSETVSKNKDFDHLYQTVSITCKVTKSGVKLSNRAEITDEVATDREGNIIESIKDKDSTPDSLRQPTLEGYYDEYNKEHDVESAKRGSSFFPGEENGKEEDDVDFETVYAEPIGVLGLFKYDEETGKALEGAKFRLKADKDSEEFVTEELTTGKDGAVFFENLEAGKDYYAVETVAPEGYKKIEEPIKVTAKAFVEALDIEDLVKVGNKKIPGVVGLYKYDKKTAKALEGAKFRLKADKDSEEFVTEELTTGKDGTVFFENLEAGKDYYAVETYAPEGFKKIEEPIKVTALEFAEALDIEDFVKVGNDRIQGVVGLYKYDKKTGKALEGAKFRLKADKDSEEFVTEELTTGKDGAVFFENLEAGKDYYAVETFAPEGFKKIDEPIKVTALEFAEALDIEDFVKVGNDRIQGVVGLYKYDEETGKALEGAKFRLKADKDSDEFVTEELTTGKDGAVFFENLEAGKDYYAVETFAPVGYKKIEEPIKVTATMFVEALDIEDFVKVGNKPEKTEVSGKKTWNDNGNQDGKRPESITVRLLADGTEVASKEVKEADEWKYSFTNLAKYNEGKEIVYTVTEDEVADYETEINGFDIVNTYNPETTKVEGKKTWNDGGNFDGLRPETLTIYLLADGEQVSSKTISEAEEWKYSFTDLAKYKNGKAIVYTVDESEVEGYTKKIEGNNIINTHIPETTEVSGKKTWNDGGDKYKKRPETLTVYLLANGERVDSVEISEANNWEYSFTELSPRDENGKAIEYSVDESEVPGYTMELNGFDLINTYVEEFVSVSGKKTWVDEDNADKLRPTALRIMLYADGEEVDSTITTAENKWAYSFTNLPKYNEEGNEIEYSVDEESVKYYTKQINGYDITNTHVVVKPADLKLIKYISAINGVELEGESVRFKGYDLSPLKDDDKTTTTANYDLVKTPILVNKGDVVTYTIKVFNEGNIDAYARLIMENIPEGLQYLPGDETNKYYGWTPVTATYNIENEPTKAKHAFTEYLSKSENPDKMLKAYDGGDKLDEQEVKISFLVVSENTNEDVITNRAQIGRQTDENDEDVRDIDSTPKIWKDDDDDQDIDNIIVTYTDLALKKYITKINDKEISPSREPVYDASPLLEGDHNASYTKATDVVNVSKNDIVTYAFRVYNEGTKDELVTLIKDDMPEGLEFIPQEGWKMVDELGNEVKFSENAKFIVCDSLKNEIIKAFNKETKELDNRTVEVEFRVVAPEKYTKVMTNHAQISAYVDTNGNVTKDRDSTPDKWEEGDDDQDIENVKITYADLALKKFITKVNDNEVSPSREPIVNVDAMKNDENVTDAIYTKAQDVVEVQENDIVTYTLRIYNEGTKTVAPSIVKDDVPEGLEFIPQDGWTMYDENGNVVSEPAKAKYVTTTALENEYLTGFDRATMDKLDSRDVTLKFKVLATTEKDKIIINHAQISKEIDQNKIDVEDIDSKADVWNEGEDDQDIEKVRVKYFDLALEKWVSKAIIIENGKERVTETGITEDMDPDPVVKVDLKKSKIDNVIVKFEYTIKVTNEGEIAGYPEEIEEKIPDGLIFVQQDNLDWEVIDGKIVTHQLENTLLNPGESETVTFILTWDNRENNLGLKTNVAEISKHSDGNKHSITDIDSTPGNNNPGEDDIDDAPVMLTVKTGAAKVYTGLAIAVISIIGIGVLGIKKYVLR